MRPAVKWIGGATLGVLLVFGTAVASERTLEAIARPAERHFAAERAGTPQSVPGAVGNVPQTPAAA